MGLFKWFKTYQNGETSTPMVNVTEIPEDLFIEKREPQEQHGSYLMNGEGKGIISIYTFLETDFEPKGYNDALVNPDQSNKLDGIYLIKTQLKIKMDREINYYEKLIKDIDCHIRSRSDAGLIDLVDELRTKKEKSLADIEKIREIELQMVNDSGLFERVVLSYQQGFKRGLAAITKSQFQ